MQELTAADKPVIDFPREDERVNSAHYTFRVSAPMTAEKVEVCVDGAPWQLCRYSGGYWWYDWAGYYSGEHEVVARMLPFDSRAYVLAARRFSVELAPTEPLGAKTQYSVVTANEPATLERVTRLLSAEDVSISGMMTVELGEKAAVQFLAEKRPGLREKLENAGLSVLEREVFQCELSNCPDELNRLVNALVERGAAIRTLFGTVEGSRVKLIVGVDRPDLAAPVFAAYELACPA